MASSPEGSELAAAGGPSDEVRSATGFRVWGLGFRVQGLLHEVLNKAIDAIGIRSCFVLCVLLLLLLLVGFRV